MKIVVIGGTGLIGSKAVNILRQRGHEVVAASPSSGVNTLTGEGLAEALKGAQVVIDVANSPSFEDKPALEFFETSGRNLLGAEKSAGVRHHVALSVVGTNRLTGSGPGSLSGYFRAKMAQENLIKASGIPFTIVHATQFFEFVKNIAQSATDGSTIRLSPVLMQPMVSDDVASAVAEVALGAPMNAIVEVAGPDKIRQDELVRQFLTATGDPRNVVTDTNAGYYGIKVNDQSLVPGDNPRLGPTHFEDWLSRTAPQHCNCLSQTQPQPNPHTRKEYHNETNPNFKNLRTYCLHTHRRRFRCGLSDGRYDGTPGGEGDGALLERPAGVSRQGRSDDHGGVSSGQRGPDTSPPRTRVYLRAGGLDHNAGQRRARGDSDTWPDLL